MPPVYSDLSVPFPKTSRTMIGWVLSVIGTNAIQGFQSILLTGVPRQLLLYILLCVYVFVSFVNPFVKIIFP